MNDTLDRVRTGLADRYAVDREIGRGGMATVYLALDLKHNRKVAVKVLLPELSRSVTAERFLREIEMAAGLAHPNIVPVYDSGEAGDLLFYVMPFIDGETLHHRLLQDKRLSVEEAVRIGIDIAGALSYAHKQNIIHRDIKPGNILFLDGHAVVTDFGIGKAMCDSCDDDDITLIGGLVGTPNYMSPEQAAGEPVDQRTDVYSLGCVLFEMLSGQHRGCGGHQDRSQAQCRGSRQRMSPVESFPEKLPRTIDVQDRVVHRHAGEHDHAHHFHYTDRPTERDQDCRDPDQCERDGDHDRQRVDQRFEGPSTCQRPPSCP